MQVRALGALKSAPVALKSALIALISAGYLFINICILKIIIYVIFRFFIGESLLVEKVFFKISVIWLVNRFFIYQYGILQWSYNYPRRPFQSFNDDTTRCWNLHGNDVLVTPSYPPGLTLDNRIWWVTIGHCYLFNPNPAAVKTYAIAVEISISGGVNIA